MFSSCRARLPNSARRLKELSSTMRKQKAAKKPKLTDADRHKRFVEMAKEVGASDNPKDFDKAFKSIVSVPETRNRRA